MQMLVESRKAHYKSLNTRVLEKVFEFHICSLCLSYSECACYWYNPKYYESGTFDIHIMDIGSRPFELFSKFNSINLFQKPHIL